MSIEYATRIKNKSDNLDEGSWYNGNKYSATVTVVTRAITS